MTPTPKNDEDDAAREELREQRFRALGTRTPRCTFPGCTETDPFALTGATPQIVCREHAANAQGRAWTEAHHPAGRTNSPVTVDVSANDHAVLSAVQSVWPREVLRNPDGSPLLMAAAALRGWLDVLRLIIERTVGWIPVALELLDALLIEFIGPGWWDTLGWHP
jgi:hypothetical protein